MRLESGSVKISEEAGVLQNEGTLYFERPFFLGRCRDFAKAARTYRMEGSGREFPGDSKMQRNDKMTGRVDAVDYYKKVVTGVFPSGGIHDVLVEVVRDQEDPERLEFLCWCNDTAVRNSQIVRGETCFVPPTPRTPSYFAVTLARDVRPCRSAPELLDAIVDVISTYVDIPGDGTLLVASFVLSTWFPDCFEAVPYLWIVGPLGSGKTRLLHLLSCLCRRSLLVSDLRAGSLYQLTDASNSTLLMDELEVDQTRQSLEILRLLRTGTVPGVPTVRNGKIFSTFGFKVISSRSLPPDAALSSRAIAVPLLQTDKDMPLLRNEEMQAIEQQFQPELLMFRFTRHSQVQEFRLDPSKVRQLNPRMKQIARAICAPLQTDSEAESRILAILEKIDTAEKAERFLEPEWLVTLDLFELIHSMETSSLNTSCIFVGGISASINIRLDKAGEDLKFGARRVGATLKALGLRTERMGRMGRGLKMTSSLREQVHEIAHRLGINRRMIATMSGLESGYGGRPCGLCDAYGLTGGLRFVELNHNRAAFGDPTTMRANR